MSADDFFSRWSKRKAEQPGLPETTPASAAEPTLAPTPAPELPPPTLDDVAALGYDADFTRFVKPGVDETVRRSAMKKLFTDPHFNVMDGLDIYIDDYTKFEPLPAAMLAMLVHAKPLLDPLGHLQQPAMKMLDQVTQLAGANPAGDAQAASADEAAVPEPGQQAAGPVQASRDPADNGANEAPDEVAAEAASEQSDEQADHAAEPPTDTASPQDDHTI